MAQKLVHLMMGSLLLVLNSNCADRMRSGTQTESVEEPAAGASYAKDAPVETKKHPSAEPGDKVPSALKEQGMENKMGAVPSTSSQAVEAFVRFWRVELMPKLTKHPSAKKLDALVSASGMAPAVVLRPCAEYSRLVSDRIGTQKGNPHVLHGTVQDLPKEGSCWDILYSGMLEPGLGGCVDAQNGHIVLVWETPEG